MHDDISDIMRYYDNPECGEDSRLEQHQLERDIILRYFEQYLPPSSDILEIGAATGQHTVWLARQGHRVTAVDLSTSLAEKCRKRLSIEELEASVDCHIADARDLSSLPQKIYDAVLMMGPLYHLILPEDRIQALRESYVRLRPGGIFFSALINRYGILGDLLQRNPSWIENQKEVRSLIKLGYNTENPREGGYRGHFAIVEEIRSLHEEIGLQSLVLAGVEPVISADDESYNRLQGGQRELWLDLFYEISQEPSLLASSRHLLYIGRKPTE